jgi:hypothetical protein
VARVGAQDQIRDEIALRLLANEDKDSGRR